MKSYLKHKILNLVDIKELTAVEYLDFEGKYKGYVEKHDFWELCFTQKGEIGVTIDKEYQTLSENSLILIPPDKSHSYFSAEGNQNKVFVICFQCFSQALRPLSKIKFDLDSKNHNLILKVVEESLSTFRMNEKELLEMMPTPVIGGQQMIILLLETIFINLLRYLSSKENSNIVFLNDDNFYKNLVDTIISFLKENTNKKLSLDEICFKFNYSKSFLCKVFKAQTGETIITFFNKLKVSEAKKLLEQKEKSTTVIANSLGFQEVKYFDYIFKKYTGLSPAAYREKHTRRNKP